MTTQFKDHKVRFGPTAASSGAGAVTVGSVDLNSSDLLNASGGNSLWEIGVWLLCYNTTDGTYPFFYYFEESVQKLSSTWLLWSGPPWTPIKSVAAGGSITVSFSITSTSVFNVIVTRAGAANYTCGGWIQPRMYEI